MGQMNYILPKIYFELHHKSC